MGCLHHLLAEDYLQCEVGFIVSLSGFNFPFAAFFLFLPLLSRYNLWVFVTAFLLGWLIASDSALLSHDGIRVCSMCH